MTKKSTAAKLLLMRLALDDHFEITDIAASDRETYVEYLNDPQIYAQTLSIPRPYTAADADAWIVRCAEKTSRMGVSSNWAIRDEAGRLAGGIGFLDYEPGAFRAELGYWLARPYWNRGIVTRAVRAAAAHGFDDLGLLRITANVFSFNDASARVLEKNGFQLEGVLRGHYRKDGRIFDGKLYGLLKSDIAKGINP